MRDENKLRIIISQCLRDSAVIWHLIKLSQMKKNFLREINLNSWYIVLTNRFKKRASIALQRIQKKRYITSHVREQKNFRSFAQDIFKHVKIAEMRWIYYQLTLIWNNLNWEFKRDILKLTLNIIIRQFFDQLNSKSNIWYEMNKRIDDQFSN